MMLKEMTCFSHLPYLPNQICDDRAESGYITGCLNGRWIEAMVYDEPSQYGINCGRVSKLAIGKTAMRDRQKDFFEQCDYAYDRDQVSCGWFDRKMINKMVAWLEALPKTSETVKGNGNEL